MYDSLYLNILSKRHSKRIFAFGLVCVMLLSPIATVYASCVCCSMSDSEKVSKDSKSSSDNKPVLKDICVCDVATSDSTAVPSNSVTHWNSSQVITGIELSDPLSIRGPTYSDSPAISSAVSGNPPDHLFIQHCSFLT